ncbi:MAG TPA: hypothetical protein VFZ40_13280 [Pyrinomonadaceae bacterium]
MKNIKGFTLGLVLGLSIAVAGIAYAQTNTQSDQNKKAECCSAAMSCCSGESCAMMKDGAMKEGAKKSEGHGCCCCSGESCNMKHMKDMKHMKTKDVKDSPSKP